jgi:4'-phosphopantetheinyl transferase
VDTHHAFDLFDKKVKSSIAFNNSVSLHMFVDDGAYDFANFIELLGPKEQQKANGLQDITEQQHFTIRRAFQRYVVARTIGWTSDLSTLPLTHQQDQRTRCPVAQDLVLSFTSSKNNFAAATCRDGEIGVDLEINRPINNLEGLAERFFTPEETQDLMACPAAERDGLFLKYWTAKEAGLKALGRGIVSGLNSFTLRPENGVLKLSGPVLEGQNGDWKLLHLQEPMGCTFAAVSVQKSPEQT